MAARSSVGRAALALLALLALAFAPRGAQAACTAGSLTLDLLSTGGGSCDSSPYAVCLSSFRVDVASSCNITIVPQLASNDYVAGIWSSNSGGTYQRLVACPTWAREAVMPAGGSSASATQMKAAIKLALEQQIYGSDYPQTLSSTSFPASGKFRLVTTIPGSCTLDYAITQATADYTSQIDANAVQVSCGLLGLLCKSDLLLPIDGCGAGKRAVNLGSSLGNVCAMCPPGTYSTTGKVSSCTACGTGTAAGSVGGTSSSVCQSCAAGTYASTTGQSTCLPCNPGTYQASTGQAACVSCPASSYARLPGADQCVKCIAGVASKCIVGDCSSDAPTPGYHVLSVDTASSLPSATCALSSPLSYGSPPMFQQCTLTPAGTTLLSVYVDKTCAVEISPLKDTACAEPGQPYWSTVRIRGHYVTPTKISTMLNTAATNLTSSYLLTLVPATGTSLTMSYWPATTDESKANDLAGVCSGTVSVIGGKVVNVDSGAANCPAGSYDSAAVDGCRPCPVGNTCAQGSTTPTSCAADYYQPYLGGASCLQCNALADPRYTSNAGDDYCLVEWVDTTCSNGQEYDPVSKQCQACEAGSARNVTRESACVLCPPGYYSGPGATDCSICPLNQFSPVWGLANRTAGDQKCIYCATGYVAVNDADEVGKEGSTGCMACNPGLYAAIVSPKTYHTCEACDEGYYRSGDSSPANNVCRKIPDGYKEKNRTVTTYDRAEIVPCDKGEVSSWAGAARTPADPQLCQACLGDNTYAQRMGMKACVPCPGGTYPTKSVGTLPGNDRCSKCTGSTYRSVTSTKCAGATCDSCLAGRETQPAANAMCIPCDAGYYMPDDLGGYNLSRPANGTTCLPCPVNTYQPNTGRANCLPCPPGTSTQDTGNAVCTACPLGSYSPTSSANCIGAPAGTFVNVTGAKMATACPKGTFSNEVGASECEPCAAGQYSNADGGRTCKTCPAGTYSGGGATTCKQCSPGFYSTAGSGVCSPCKPGTYASGYRSATCAACPRGNQCPTIATTSPQPCPRGYFSNKDGLRLCLPCPANMYRNTTGATSCITCPQGFSTRGLTGQSACQQLARTFRRLQL